MKVIGILMVITGILIRYVIKRRRFNRRNAHGVELFSSYERGMLLKAVEWILFWGGTFLVFCGLFYLCFK